MAYFVVLFLALVAVSHEADFGVTTDRTVVKELKVTNGGNYGYWTDPQFCPRGSFASGYNMKVRCKMYIIRRYNKRTFNLFNC